MARSTNTGAQARYRYYFTCMTPHTRIPASRFMFDRSCSIVRNKNVAKNLEKSFQHVQHDV